MENLMKNSIIKIWPQAVFLFLIITVSGIVAAQEIPPPRPPANVAGNWTVYTKGPTGNTETKSIQLKQNGTTITGHFKGPDWSGGLEGTINEQHIVFRTKSRFPMVYRGRVDGDTIQGTFHVRIGTGEWQAQRSN
jgi:hypothetical protein